MIVTDRAGGYVVVDGMNIHRVGRHCGRVVGYGLCRE